MMRHRTDSVLLITQQIDRLLKEQESVFFVQVGSNDGVRGDPLYRLASTYKTWSGILIEPVPFLFERLMNNYSNSKRFIFENVAIGERRGTSMFHYVSESAISELGDDLPYWYNQLGSFSRGHILKHLNGKLEPFIVEQEVRCFPLADVLERNNVDRLDLVHIDAEGFDYKVLSQIDFERYSPSLVIFEHTNLSSEERANATALLRRSGYKCLEYRKDILATLEPSRKTRKTSLSRFLPRHDK
jgi:FkbM family methyltransferase